VIGGIVLAAGEGRRFGRPKQLVTFRGRPLLEHALAAMAASAVDERLVVLGANATAVLREVDLHGARAVLCNNWELGQAESLRTGLDALSAEVEAATIALGDQPLLSPRAIDRVLGERDGVAAALRASYAGVPGHPVVLERALFERARHLRGDTGARELLDEVGAKEVPCDGLGRPDDVDTPEQLEAIS
jgi:molybdenum cofactor cytidylyltransferase